MTDDLRRYVELTLAERDEEMLELLDWSAERIAAALGIAARDRPEEPPPPRTQPRKREYRFAKRKRAVHPTLPPPKGEPTFFRRTMERICRDGFVPGGRRRRH